MSQRVVPAPRPTLRAALTGTALCLLMAGALAWPVYVEIAARSRFHHGTLEAHRATVLETEVETGTGPAGQAWSAIGLVLSLEDGSRLRKPGNDLGPWPARGDSVEVGVVSGQVVSLDGEYVRNMFPFFHFVLLMALSGTTVFTTVTFLRLASRLPAHRTQPPTYYAWPAAWLCMPVALAFSVVFDSPWWPVVAWGASTTLFLAFYLARYKHIPGYLRPPASPVDGPLDGRAKPGGPPRRPGPPG